MGPWRGRGGGALACAAIALASFGVGCGVQEHANEPRPQAPTRVTVTLTGDGVSVAPDRVAIRPEPNSQIPQNKAAGQPVMRTDAPLIVVFTASNQTAQDGRLLVTGNGREAVSEAWVGHGNVTMQTALPTGSYTVRAQGIPGAKPARFVVGPLRTSSENDLLLP